MRIAKVALALICYAATVCGQTRDADVSFEVVSVKASGAKRLLPPDASGRQFSNERPFRYTGQSVTANQTLRGLIRQAYSVEDWQIVGPSWMESLTYEISATMPPDTSRERARLMLRSMLAERFRLRFHLEQKDILVYALVEGKSGFKLREATDSSATPFRFGRGMFNATGNLDSIIASFETYSDRPVLNTTGIHGAYRVELRWTPDDMGAGRYDPAFWDAVERVVGLKIQKQKVSREVIEIEGVEREPTAN